MKKQKTKRKIEIDPNMIWKIKGGKVKLFIGGKWWKIPSRKVRTANLEKFQLLHTKGDDPSYLISEKSNEQEEIPKSKKTE